MRSMATINIYQLPGRILGIHGISHGISHRLQGTGARHIEVQIMGDSGGIQQISCYMGFIVGRIDKGEGKFDT